MSKTILITGASRGFGKIWTEAFLKNGFNVIATARNIASLSNLITAYPTTLLPLALDVTNKNQCVEVVNKAYQHFGKLDVLINNAGYGLFGMVEEASEQETRDQFDTNVFGTLWMTQAAIPLMRSQGGGHIIQLSSVLGIATLPLLGLYNATKWAIEGLTESLATEVKAFGINTTLVEPIAYATDFSSASGVTSKPIEVYAGLKEVVYEQFKNMPSGDPAATADVMLKLVVAENPPARVFLGKTALPWVKQVYNERLAQWEATNDWAEAAHG
jgi:NAD(P)-dependent dehydrogenase (short-subunit alcohol dehydrogenase family)